MHVSMMHHVIMMICNMRYKSNLSVVSNPSSQKEVVISEGEVGGWGRDPKKCTGRDWVGDGVEYHLMSPTPRH